VSVVILIPLVRQPWVLGKRTPLGGASSVSGGLLASCYGCSLIHRDNVISYASKSDDVIASLDWGWAAQPETAPLSSHN
jgi:hypothetical protein